MKAKYELIYSLGHDCACTIYLNKFGLRSYAGPFDWINTPSAVDADFQTKIMCILNDFNDFLNPMDFQFLPKNPTMFNDERCDYYENIKTGFWFFHDFPVDVPFDDSFPKVKESYQKRISRFYKEIKKNNRILFIWFSYHFISDNKLLIDLCNKVCKKFDKQIDFLFIEHNESLPLGKSKKTVISPNITKYSLYTRKWDLKGKLTTLGQEEYCGKIFKQYKLSFLAKIKWRLSRQLSLIGFQIFCRF